MKINLTLLLFILLSASGASFGADNADLPFVTAASIPPPVAEAFNNFASSEQYVFSAHLNPFFIQGDFNGDGMLDAAILVQEKASRKKGIAVVHGGSLSVSILGAGRDFGNGGDDFSWLNAWYASPKGTVGQGAGGESPPQPGGDAVTVIKTESASALLYWTGKNYAWYQQGD